MSNFKRIGLAAGMSGAMGWAGLCGLLAGGCTSVIYDSNPEGPTAQLEEKPDFASHTVQNLLATSIRWAVEQYPPPADELDGWFAVNLPAGLTRDQYIEVARQIGDRAAPITPELTYLPTYHVGWVWMRGDNARVDVVRPVYVLSRTGDPVYQAITLHLRRRFSAWRVERTQPWAPGVVTLPPLAFLPEPEPEATDEAAADATQPGAPQESTEPLDDQSWIEEAPAEGDTPPTPDSTQSPTPAEGYPVAVPADEPPATEPPVDLGEDGR